jgi:hypothetical protein
MTRATSIAQVIAGEATAGTPEERWNDMVRIASVIQNRADVLGVGLDDVVSAPNQFSAYNHALPPGVGQSIVDMAQAAVDYVATNGPVISATYYSTPAAQQNLPTGLQAVDQSAGHIFMVDPANRPIVTATGAIRPDMTKLASNVGLDPLQQAINAPYENNGLINGVTSLTNAPAQAVTSTSVPASALDPAFSPSGLLSGNFPASKFTAPSANMGILATQDQDLPNLGPALNSFAPVAAATPVSTRFQNQWEAMASAPPVGDATGISVTSLPTGQSDVAAGNFDPARMANSSALARVMQTPSAYLDAPEPHPNVNNFADMAAAGPIAAPVSVQGILGAMNQPNLAASASVPMSASLFSPAAQTPSLDVAASGALGVNPALSASAVANPMASVPATADLGTNPALAAQTSVNPSVKTPSLNSFADLASAPPVSAPTVGGIDSPEMQAMRENVANQLAGMKSITASPTNNSFSALAAAGPMAAPVSATPTGILGTTPALTADTTASPGLLSSYQPTQTPTPSENAITGILGQSPSLLSSTTIGSQVPSLSTPTPTSSMLANSVTPNYQQYQSFVPDDVQPISTPAAPAYDPAVGYQQAANSLMAGGMLNLDGSKFTGLNGDLAPNPELSSPSTVNVAQDPAVTAPSLDTTPADTTQSNVTVQGPSTTAATTQQSAKLSGAFPAAPAKTGMLGGLLNKDTVVGGLLGGLAAGPIGGVLGGLLGNAVNKNGGLTGLLGGQPPSINNIGAGLQNVASVYGASMPGLQAYTNNGGAVTSAGDGWTHYTSPNGVTTSFGPNMVTASYWGPAISSDSSRTPSGPPGGGGGVGGFGSLL